MTSNVHPGIRAFDAFQNYWMQLSQAASTGFVPLHRDFNPMKIPRLLPHVYMSEWASQTKLRIRLSGSALEDTFGRGLKGTDYLDLRPPEDRDFLTKLLHAVVDQPCGLKVHRRMVLSTGAHQMRSLSFPLADKDGRPRFIVGMMNVEHDVPMTLFERAEHPNPTIKTIAYIDIGAGTPPLPAFPPPPASEIDQLL